MEIKVRYLQHHDGLPRLKRMTSGSSGFDLQATVVQPMVIPPGESALVETGIELSIPAGYEAQVRPRSGLALKHGIGILNSPGTIDSDYRGEVRVILHNFGGGEFVVGRGDRIAQLVVVRLPEVDIVEVEELDSTPRGSGGFGHTG